MNSIINRLMVAGLSLALLAVTALPAAGADKKSSGREREMIYHLQQAQKQLESEKSGLVQEKDEMAAKLKSAGGKARSLKHQIAELNKQLDDMKTQLSASADKLKATEVRLDETGHQLQETKQALLERTAELKRQSVIGQEQLQTMGRQSHMIEQCDAKNAKLVKIGDEVIERYRNIGVSEVLKKAEPLTGLKQVEYNNLAQEYRDRVAMEKQSPVVISR